MMDILRTFTLYCVMLAFVLLLLNDQSLASEVGYKRGWRPQGRFGKRTLGEANGKYDGVGEEMTRRESYLLDSGIVILSHYHFDLRMCCSFDRVI